MYFNKVLLYTAETWTCTKRLDGKQAAEMKLLRAVVRKTRRDRIGNTYIRGELKMEETQNQIMRSKLRRFGHV